MSVGHVISSWGATLRPGRTTFLIPEHVNLRITNAALIVDDATSIAHTHSRTSLWMMPLKQSGVVSPILNSSNKIERVILFTLISREVEHHLLEITLVENDYIAFEVIGKSSVCLSGNYIAISRENITGTSLIPALAEKLSSCAEPSSTPQGKKRARVEPLFVPTSSLHSIAHHEVDAIPSASSIRGSSPRKAISHQFGCSPFAASPTVVGAKRARIASSTETTGDSSSESSIAASPIPVKSLLGAPRRSATSTKNLQAEGHTHYVQPAVPLFNEAVIKDHKVGSGALRAARGDEISMWYRLQLANEVTVQSSMEGTPFVKAEITLGQGFILPAIDSGIIGMKIGGERLIKVPPTLGFGDREHDAIPPNSTLFFQCKLLSIRQPDAK
ncbi:uncharacterized protein LAESUDRAFT_761462 [Laetiporus sulphureus 93-53]|uniref:peptidylprolyl isomerase n=1 Tax=Laetiporus sulphureus 93-53 TaxID=1314785 RepID=A0A165D3X2_9APHY|nr:uncharacterized protein LAESUDRAFT_761462 [Laetiporus sulphureus 93-53]KZT04107.1 hypothetical protein LAESUDRAFT_761462 [Laetiporus sulphureus 93-53]